MPVPGSITTSSGDIPSTGTTVYASEVPPHSEVTLICKPSDSSLAVEAPAGGKGALGIQAVTDQGEIRSLEAMEADMIRLALGRYRGHMTEVARRLGIGRSTLYRKMREFGLEERLN